MHMYMCIHGSWFSNARIFKNIEGWSLKGQSLKGRHCQWCTCTDKVQSWFFGIYKKVICRNVFSSISLKSKEEFTVLWFMNKRLCKKLMQRWDGLRWLQLLLHEHTCECYNVSIITVLLGAQTRILKIMIDMCWMDSDDANSSTTT